MLHLNFKPFPVLTTHRLRLRRLAMTDAEEIMMLRSNEQVNKFLDRPKPVNINDAKSFIEKIESGINKNESIYWVITLKDSDTLIGTICMWNISIGNKMAEIGYELHPQWQGKELMNEAIREVIEYGFNKIKLEIITACTHIDNTRSTNVLIKNNFLLDKNYEYVEKKEAGELCVYYLKKNK